MELHSTWIAELTAPGKSYHIQLVEGASVDCLTSDEKNAFMAQLLLAFTFMEQGKFEDACCHLDVARVLCGKVSDDPDQKEGCMYLVNGLSSLLSDRKMETLENIQHKDFVDLGEKGKAIVYACKGYAMSRWDPETLNLSMVDAFEKAHTLDPENCNYVIGYALTLGRQRRQLSSTNSITEEEISSRLEGERLIWQKCEALGEAHEKILGKTFTAFLNSEMIQQRNISCELKSNLFQQAMSLLEDVWKGLRSPNTRYDKITIAKRAAMTYKRLMNNSKLERENCRERAEELFGYAYNLAAELESAGNLFYYKHLSNEYGKFLVSSKKFNEAKSVLKKTWKYYNFGEALLEYIHCCRKQSRHYNPLLDIEEGLPTLEVGKYKVYVMCLKAEYLYTMEKSRSDHVRVLLDALLIDPKGTFMRSVPRRWGAWPDDVRKYSLSYRHGHFVDYVKVLRNELLFLSGNWHGNNEERLLSLKQLVEFCRTVRPLELKTALNVLEKAIRTVNNDSLKEKMIEQRGLVLSLMSRTDVDSLGGIPDSLKALSI